MNRIKKILMERDGLASTEAESLIEEVREMMVATAAYGDVQEAEDIFTDELGLEPDYIVDLFM